MCAIDQPLLHATETTEPSSARGLVAMLRALRRGALSDADPLEVLREGMTGLARATPDLGPAPWTRTLGRYPRVLLNEPGDDFQAVVCFWPPGARSAIHDHSDTVGGVVALYGEVAETKYATRRRADGRLELVPEEVSSLSRGAFTPILPEDGQQLHDMRNEGLEWGATLHVYLRPIVEFGVYVRERDGAYRREARSLWFDHERGAARWDRIARRPPLRERPTVRVHRGACRCGAVRLSAHAAPALQVRCHCGDCRAARGLTHTSWAFFARGAVRLDPTHARTVTYENDSGYRVTRSVCRSCGTEVLLESDAQPQLSGVPVDTLHDAGFFDPELDVYLGSAAGSHPEVEARETAPRITARGAAGRRAGS